MKKCRQRYVGETYSAACQQVLLDDESKKYTTVKTHKGLFVCNRLCFGINSAVSIQRIMENVMKGLNVVVHVDDLLVRGRDETERLMNLDRVLQRDKKMA